MNGKFFYRTFLLEVEKGDEKNIYYILKPNVSNTRKNEAISMLKTK